VKTEMYSDMKELCELCIKKIHDKLWPPAVVKSGSSCWQPPGNVDLGAQGRTEYSKLVNDCQGPVVAKNAATRTQT